MEEVAWMASNWKKLEAIGGCLNSDERMGTKLRTTTESLGIRYDSEFYVWREIHSRSLKVKQCLQSNVKTFHGMVTEVFSFFY